MAHSRSQRRNAARSVKPETAPPAPGMRVWQWGVLAVSLPLVLCAQKLNLDLWHDEIYTVQEFVSGGAWKIVTDYSAPNNHIFYSLVLLPFYCASDSSFMLRLPSLICAAGTLCLTFATARRLHGLTAAVAAAALLGLTQFYLQFAMQVRGYSLSMLLAAILAGMVWGESSWRRWAAIALSGAAFLYTLPTNVLFVGPLAALATLRRSWIQRQIKPAIVELSAWLAAGSLAALLYLPVIGQLRGHAAGSVSWSGVAALAWRATELTLRDAWPLAPILLLGFGRLMCKERTVAETTPTTSPIDTSLRHRAAGPLLAASVWLGSFLLAGLLRIGPFERNFTPLLPLWGLAAGCLLAEGLAVFRHWAPANWPPEVATIAGLLLTVGVLAPPAFSYSQRLESFREGQFAQDGYYNYYAANYHPAAAARYLAGAVAHGAAYRIAFADEDYINLMYYLTREGLSLRGDGKVGDGADAAIYLISPPLRNDAALAERCGLSVESVKGFPLVKDFGYYRLFEGKERNGGKGDAMSHTALGGGATRGPAE